MTYSIDFRKKVLKIREKEGLSIEGVAIRFGVGKASVMRWLIELEPKKTRNKSATKIDMEALRKDIEESPDSYQYERAERLGVSQSGIYWALKRLNVTYKKNTNSSKSRRRKALIVSKQTKYLSNQWDGYCLFRREWICS
ncbi:MAG: IS630 transposase-related protein [Nitrospira sp.]|nr:IS630 transposase-related protein [Nitrospira sp.]